MLSGLKKSKISGFSKSVELTGDNYYEYVKGKKGIIFFKDYWLRTGEKERTGDHIDLWWGTTLKKKGTFFSAMRHNFPSFSKDYLDMSDLKRSKKVIFWEFKSKSKSKSSGKTFFHSNF